MLLRLSLALACLVAIATPLSAQQELFDAPSTSALLARTTSGETAIQKEARTVANGKVELEPLDFLLSPEEILRHPNASRRLLGKDVQPGTAARLVWKPSNTFSGMAVETPVLVVNGAYDGPTLCLTAAVHGDELNGIEMVRRV
ncbi:MAG: succinylglutamate desuccinylase/aspartoacylase family protein, partial [Halieaceae bacterium]|nr:succinylglutamate desuccinylase/aspartoacylase family protein [Halieaceae bacterium]